MNVVYKATTNFEPPPKKRNVNILFFFHVCSLFAAYYDFWFTFYSAPCFHPLCFLFTITIDADAAVVIPPTPKKIISHTRTEISEQQNRLWKFLRCRCEQNCSHLVLLHTQKMMSGLGKDLKEFKTHTYIHTRKKYESWAWAPILFTGI